MSPLPSTLPIDCNLRPAQAADRQAIWKLVLGAWLDPTQLRWQQFWVIECRQQVIACGQLRNLEAGQELGSLVVARSWRGKGLGTVLTQQLIAQATGSLYLECLGHRLQQFYQRLGFQDVVDHPSSVIPKKFRLTRTIATRFHLPLFVMVHRETRS
jgi:amino-acid N-acetyltransferase